MKRILSLIDGTGIELTTHCPCLCCFTLKNQDCFKKSVEHFINPVYCLYLVRTSQSSFARASHGKSVEILCLDHGHLNVKYFVMITACKISIYDEGYDNCFHFWSCIRRRFFNKSLRIKMSKSITMSYYLTQ